MKLMIAVPTVDYVHAAFTQSLTNLAMNLVKKGTETDVRLRPGTSVHIGREYLAEAAVTEGVTHVLWIDSDMTFQPDIVDDLLWSGKDMVCGAFVSRRPPFSPCVYTSIEKGDIRRVEKFGTEPFRVAGCGFAMVLTSVELLSAVHDRFGTCFEMNDLYFSEDLAFCQRVNALGREIWCEPTVRPGHIAHTEVYAGGDQNG